MCVHDHGERLNRIKGRCYECARTCVCVCDCFLFCDGIQSAYQIIAIARLLYE